MQKLCDGDVIVILRRLAKGEKQSDIAADYGVSRGTISHIAQNKSFKHITRAFADITRAFADITRAFAAVALLLVFTLGLRADFTQGLLGLTPTSSTTFIVGAGCSVLNPCNVRWIDTNTVYPITAPAQVAVTALATGTQALWVYINTNGSLTIGHPIAGAVTCVSGCGTAVMTDPPANSMPLFSWYVQNGTLMSQGPTDWRAFLASVHMPTTPTIPAACSQFAGPGLGSWVPYGMGTVPGFALTVANQVQCTELPTLPCAGTASKVYIEPSSPAADVGNIALGFYSTAGALLAQGFYAADGSGNPHVAPLTAPWSFQPGVYYACWSSDQLGSAFYTAESGERVGYMTAAEASPRSFACTNPSTTTANATTMPAACGARVGNLAPTNSIILVP